MTSTIRATVALLAFLASAVLARADVKIQEKNQMKMEGAVGGLLNRFGGKAAKEGLVQTVSVRGDRKLTLGEDAGELVDLAEERIYHLDLRKKTYTVTTFAELREQAAKAEREARGEEPRKRGKEEERPPPEEQIEVDIDVTETGQKKSVNGFETRQVVTTITTRKKGKTLEEGGGTVITADSWLTRDVKARDEVAAFDRRYFQKLFGKSAAAMGEMAMAAMSAPGMMEGMAKLRENGAKLDGYPIVTMTSVESVKAPAAEGGAEEGSEDAPSSLGGLGGMFAKKLAKKATAKPAGSRSPVMSLRSEVLSVTTSVSADDVALPSELKLAKR